MTETKFTPGPWEYVPGTDHCGPYVSAPVGGDICDCYAMSNPAPGSGHVSRPIWHQDDRADANARLIAAAPALYEALSGIIEMAEDLAAIFPIKLNDEGLSAVDRARSALLLANTGGTENG